MTYNEAIKLYGNSRRKMAEDLGLSVAHYGKNPDQELPPARVFMIKTKLALRDVPNITIKAKGEVVKAG